jgi:hypothetical protein
LISTFGPSKFSLGAVTQSRSPVAAGDGAGRRGIAIIGVVVLRGNSESLNRNEGSQILTRLRGFALENADFEIF